MPFEAAAVLQQSVYAIRRTVKRGELRDVSVKAQLGLDPDEVVQKADELAEQGKLGALGPFLARQLSAGRLSVPRPAADNAAPPSLLSLLDDFRAMQGRIVAGDQNLTAGTPVVTKLAGKS